MNRDLVLALDCDGLIFDTIPLLEDEIGKINYKATSAYAKKLQLEYSLQEEAIFSTFNETDSELADRLVDEKRALYEMEIKRHRIIKDEVLEEVFPEYKNRINYRSMYQKKHLFPGVCEVIKYLYNSNRFKKIYICTHFNSVNEVIEKYRAFKEELPMLEIVFVPFHDKPYIYDKERYWDNSKRERTNKAEYFAYMTGEDLSHTIFIDDSIRICEEARSLGAMALHRDPLSDNPLLVFEELSEFLMGETDEELYQKELEYDEKYEKSYQKLLTRAKILPSKK